MMNQDLLELERLIDRGETAAALPLLQQAVSREPGYAAVRLLLARALEGEGRHEEAVAAWRMVRTLVPDSPTAVIGLKRALRSRVLSATDPGAWEMAAPLAEPPRAAASPEPAASFDGVPVSPEAAEPPEWSEFAPPAAPDVAVALAPDEAPETDPGDPDWQDVLEEADAVTGTGSPAAAAAQPDVDQAEEGWTGEEPQNLDELIRELETARIVPDPTIPAAAAEDLESDVDDVVSETLARIYENQRHFSEAARVYDKLAAQQPDRAAEFLERAEEARSRAGS